MKKAIAWMLVLLLVVLFAGCANASGGTGAESDQLADYVTRNGDYWFLTLPVSGQRISLSQSDRRLLETIDLDLLRAAEETLLAKIPSNEQGHAFSLGEKDGQSILFCEVIVPIDPPRVDEDGMTNGCGIDHDHVYLGPVTISK